MRRKPKNSTKYPLPFLSKAVTQKDFSIYCFFAFRNLTIKTGVNSKAQLDKLLEAL